MPKKPSRSRAKKRALTARETELKRELKRLRERERQIKKELKRAPKPKAKKPKGLKAKKPKAALKPKKGAAKTRSLARKVGKAAGKPFLGIKVTKIAKGLARIKREVTPKPKTAREKQTALARLGIKPYKGEARTKQQKARIAKLFGEFGEFTGRRTRVQVFETENRALLSKARRSGMAVYKNRIMVHLGREGHSPRFGEFMGEPILAVTRMGKVDRIFLGGARTFDRMATILSQQPKMPKGTYITGSFFGGPTWNRVVMSVADLQKYMESFIPHMPRGVKPTKRNIARHKAHLIRNLGLVTVAPSELSDAELEKRFKKFKW